MIRGFIIDSIYFIYLSILYSCIHIYIKINPHILWINERTILMNHGVRDAFAGKSKAIRIKELFR